MTLAVETAHAQRQRPVPDLVLQPVAALQRSTRGIGAGTDPVGEAVGLPGSEWTGSETLQGFSALTFQFKDQDKVTMIDAQGSWPGTYAQAGDKVTLKFFDGKVLYHGQIIGREMAGTAENAAAAKWSWKCTLKGGGTPVVAQPPDGTGPVTPDNLADYLKKMGFDPKVETPQVGLPYCVLNIKENDGWNFVVEVTAQKGGGMWLTVPLSQLPSIQDVSGPKVVELLALNHALAPCFFTYRATDNRLCLRVEVMGVRPQERSFRADLQMMLNQVRRTHPQWNTADWKKGG